MTNDPVGEQELHAYLDGELPAERRRAVEAWLVAHPDEAERLAEWAAQGERIRAAYDPVLSEPVPPATVAMVRRARARPLRRLAAAAAVLVAFGGGFAAGRLTPASDQALAQAGLTAHLLYIPERAHPVEVAAADRQHLESWLSKRVGLAVTAPDLSSAGLNLLGGRVAPVGSRAGALFMYENAAGERFTLLVAKATDGNRPLTYHDAGAYGAYDWSEANYGFVLAGPHDEARLEELQKKVAADWL